MRKNPHSTFATDKNECKSRKQSRIIIDFGVLCNAITFGVSIFCDCIFVQISKKKKKHQFWNVAGASQALRLVSPGGRCRAARQAVRQGHILATHARANLACSGF